MTILAPAQAAYDPIGSGTTKLTIDKSFSSHLKKEGISLTAKAGAKRKGKAITLPVTSGNVDPTTGMGEIGNQGTIAFQGAKGKVPLREVTVKAKRDTLIAKVGGSQLKVASSDKRSSARSGFGTKYTAKALKLTAKVATRLNKKLRPKTPFAQGQVIGTLTTDAQPQLVTILEQNRASIALDPAFAAKMDSLFVSINPIFPAEHPAGPTFTFPIVPGGAISPSGTEGTLRTGGSLEFLQLGAGPGLPARTLARPGLQVRLAPRSTSSPPPPSRASWGGSGPMTSAPMRLSPIPRPGRSLSPALP